MKRRNRSMPETLVAELEIHESERLRRENCMNPWNGKCANTDIVLYILYKGNRFPICHACWETISSKDVEWKYD